MGHCESSATKIENVHSQISSLSDTKNKKITGEAPEVRSDKRKPGGMNTNLMNWMN